MVEYRTYVKMKKALIVQYIWTSVIVERREKKIVYSMIYYIAFLASIFILYVTYMR